MSTKGLAYDAPSPKIPDIIAYREQKMTMAEIGGLVGVTKQRVQQLLRRHRPDLLKQQVSRKMRVKTIEAQNMIRSAVTQHLTNKEIGQNTGWKKEKVRRVLTSNGYSTNFSERLLVHKEQIQNYLWERYPQGRCSQGQLAEALCAFFGRKSLSIAVCRKVRQAVEFKPLATGRPKRESV